MAVTTSLTLSGSDNNSSGAAVSLTFTNTTVGVNNTVTMTATIGGTPISISFVAEDLQELGRKIDLIVP